MRFVRDEDGSVTIEFVLWLPVVFAMLLIAVDATFAFIGMGNMWQTARETARVVSRYGMTEAEAETWAAQQASYTTIAPTVDVAFGSGDVVVTMNMPIRAMTPFGMLGFATTYVHTTQVRHAMEPV